ncbi:MAG: SMC-Scp complex subunit ScpB [Oscillospiraceae bacterium]|nr:SMC-Scp complex subunit ScpB [Oscillospiraceae bacterium]
MYKNINKIIEGIIFISAEPVCIERLSIFFSKDKEIIVKILEEIKDRHIHKNSGIELISFNNKFQFIANRDLSEDIKKFLEIKNKIPLSTASMEVLSIIAYNQPVTKNFVEQVRGVDSSYIINNLTKKELLEENGRLDVPGRPITYITTDHFLKSFSLKNLKDLPPIPDKIEIPK